MEQIETQETNNENTDTNVKLSTVTPNNLCQIVIDTWAGRLGTILSVIGGLIALFVSLTGGSDPCTCENGTAIVNCANTNNTECDTCNYGFRKIDKQCVKNECFCKNGKATVCKEHFIAFCDTDWSKTICLYCRDVLNFGQFDTQHNIYKFITTILYMRLWVSFG